MEIKRTEEKSNIEHSVQFSNLFRILRWYCSESLFFWNRLAWCFRLHKANFIALRMRKRTQQSAHVYACTRSFNTFLYIASFRAMMLDYVKKSRTKHIYPYGYSLRVCALLMLLVVLFSKQFKWQQQWSIHNVRLHIYAYVRFYFRVSNAPYGTRPAEKCQCLFNCFTWNATGKSYNCCGLCVLVKRLHWKQWETVWWTLQNKGKIMVQSVQFYANYYKYKCYSHLSSWATDVNQNHYIYFEKNTWCLHYGMCVAAIKTLFSDRSLMNEVNYVHIVIN